MVSKIRERENQEVAGSFPNHCPEVSSPPPPRPQKLLTYVGMLQQTTDSRLPLQFLVICEDKGRSKVRGKIDRLSARVAKLAGRKRQHGRVASCGVVLSTPLLDRCCINK